MPVERTKAITDPIYHHMYGFLQKHNFLGAWIRCGYQHAASIRDHLLANKSISILYCGTATAKNPADVSGFIKNFDLVASRMVTIDLSQSPLKNLSRQEFNPVNTDAAVLPFTDNSFDYVTSDFLLSKMDLPTIISTVREWGRVIKNTGIITTTAGVRDGKAKVIDKVYDITTPLYGLHYVSKDVLGLIFQAAGLEVRFEPAKFDKKPYLYLYPDDLLMFIEAKANRDKFSQETKKAKEILKNAFFIYEAVRSEEDLAPLDLEGIIQGIMDNNFIIQKNVAGDTVGFIRVHNLSNTLMEIGSLYVLPAYRNGPEHYGVSLLTEAVNLLQSEKKDGIVFTAHPTVIKFLEQKEGKRVRMLPIDTLLVLLKDRMRSKEAFTHIASEVLKKRDRGGIYLLTSENPR